MMGESFDLMMVALDSKIEDCHSHRCSRKMAVESPVLAANVVPCSSYHPIHCFRKVVS